MFYLSTKLIEDTLAAVTFSAIGKDSDDVLSRAESFRNLVRRCRRCARRPSAEKTFESRDLPERGANVLVGHHHDLVRQRSVVDLRNKVTLPYAFDLLRSRWVAAVD